MRQAASKSMLCMLHCWRELFDLRIRQVKGTGLEIPVEASRDYSFYRKVIFFHPPQKEQNTQVSRTCATKKRNVTLCRLSGDWTFLLDPFFFFLFVPALLEKLVCLPFAVDARQRAGKDNFGWHLSHEKFELVEPLWQCHERNHANGSGRLPSAYLHFISVRFAGCQ